MTRGYGSPPAVPTRLDVDAHGRVVGTPDHTSEIIEIRGRDGTPPYLVRRDDGHEVLVFPGPDTSVEHPKSRKQT
jgi:Domain of unknown function (DUF1918)